MSAIHFISYSLFWDVFLGYKEHLDWLKIDFNVAEIITVENYKRTKN